MKCAPSYDPTQVKILFPVINDAETLKKYIDYAKKHNHYELIREKLGPWFKAGAHKNLNIYDVLSVMGKPRLT